MAYISSTLQSLQESFPGQTEFHQAVKEVLETLHPLLEAHPRYEEQNILQRIIEPERQITFRVTWMDDDHRIQVNRGYRVQFNSAL
ncbi:MAG: NADP-specific glutamate dehydrogenase, partial [Bacteroidetes bacterium]|nr:NADP-specific glutamate dehydrogenase [Bacteroidota bacterium]